MGSTPSKTAFLRVAGAASKSFEDSRETVTTTPAFVTVSSTTFSTVGPIQSIDDASAVDITPFTLRIDPDQASVKIPVQTLGRDHLNINLIRRAIKLEVAKIIFEAQESEIQEDKIAFSTLRKEIALKTGSVTDESGIVNAINAAVDSYLIPPDIESSVSVTVASAQTSGDGAAELSLVVARNISDWYKCFYTSESTGSIQSFTLSALASGIADAVARDPLARVIITAIASHVESYKGQDVSAAISIGSAVSVCAATIATIAFVAYISDTTLKFRKVGAFVDAHKHKTTVSKDCVVVGASVPFGPPAGADIGIAPLSPFPSHYNSRLYGKEAFPCPQAKIKFKDIAPRPPLTSVSDIFTRGITDQSGKMSRIGLRRKLHDNV